MMNIILMAIFAILMVIEYVMYFKTGDNSHVILALLYLIVANQFSIKEDIERSKTKVDVRSK